MCKALQVSIWSIYFPLSFTWWMWLSYICTWILRFAALYLGVPLMHRFIVHTCFQLIVCVLGESYEPIGCQINSRAIVIRPQTGVNESLKWLILFLVNVSPGTDVLQWQFQLSPPRLSDRRWKACCYSGSLSQCTVCSEWRASHHTCGGIPTACSDLTASFIPGLPILDASQEYNTAAI